MSFFDHSSRKGMLVVGVVLMTFIMACLNYLITTDDPENSTNTNTNMALSQNQNADGMDPWYCSCYNPQENTTQTIDPNKNNGKPEPPVPSIDTGESIPLVVPESFKKPEQALVDKINNNLNDGRVLIVAASNYGMRDHVYNWIESLKRTNEGDKFLMFCLDQQMYDHMVAAGYEKNAATIPESWFHDEVEAGFEEYYSKKYRIITHAKTLIVQQLLYLDVTVLFSDVDIVWLRPRMREFIHTFLQIRGQTHVAYQQEGTDQRVVNSGFYMMKPTDITKRLLAETIYLGDTNTDYTQQGAMNAALDHVDMNLRSTHVVLLDVLHFPNGYVFFDNQWPQKHGVEPYMVHANYLVGNDKKSKLQDYGYWYLDDKWLESIDAKIGLKEEQEQEK